MRLAHLEPQVSLSQWDRVNSMTDEEITQNALDDEDNPPLDDDFWENARVVYPDTDWTYLRLREGHGD